MSNAESRTVNPQAKSAAARGRSEAASSEAPHAFDYHCAAELFPTRSRRPRPGPMSYKRFDTAAAAIRFAIEELPSDLLLGAYLEVNEVRFDSDGIRSLYDSERFPLKRRAASRSR